ncbi:MAG: ankyrin repeat domain-containing protein [Candidatus Aminicenantes bacterium]|nr:ankyrin repeat domain-containing protein [Candidatus Aminicenantes bacterium]
MKKSFIVFFALALAVSASALYSQDIFNAIGKGDMEQVKSIFEKDAGSMNAILDNAYTTLSFAAMVGNADMVKYLISKNAAVNNADRKIRSPIFHAVYRGHLDVVKLLAANGADMNEATLGMSLLHSAVMADHMQVAEFLLSAGRNVDEKDNYGLTPLHMAVELGHLELCKLLVAKGADLNIRCNDGATPLHLSDEANQQEIMQFLLSKGAKKVSRDFPVVKGKYLGAKNPGPSLELFNPNRTMRIIGPHSGVAISRDGKEIFWVRGDYSGKLWHMKKVGGLWTPPRVAPFSGQFDNSYPCFSADGRKLYFTSDRPKEENGKYKKGVGDIWFVEKSGAGWSEPMNVGSGVNTNGDEFIASVDKHGTIYFTRVLFKDGKVNSDIFCAEFTDGKYQAAMPMAPSINSSKFEVGPFVAPDGRYMIFGSQRFGDMTTCISFRKNNGCWTEARNIQHAFSPFSQSYVQGISADGRFILFAGEKDRSWEIYWLSAKIVEKFKEI